MECKLDISKKVTLLLGNNIDAKKSLLECIYLQYEGKAYKYDPSTRYPPSNKLADEVYKEIVNKDLADHIIDELNEIKEILPTININNFLSTLLDKNNILVILNESDFPLSNSTAYIVGREIAYLSKKNDIRFVVSINGWDLYTGIRRHTETKTYYVRNVSKVIELPEESWYVRSLSLPAVLR